jgi:hypothetical protein
LEDLEFGLVQGWFRIDSFFIILGFFVLFSTVFGIIERNLIVGSVLGLVGFDFGDEEVEGFFFDSSDDSREFEEFSVEVDEGGKLFLLDLKGEKNLIVAESVNDEDFLMNAAGDFGDLLFINIVGLFFRLPAVD